MLRFIYAFNGLKSLLNKDAHFLMHIIAAICVVIVCAILPLDFTEWLFILTAIFIVIILETLNTAIEYAVDLVTEEYHCYAEKAKDISAFAVLIGVFYALIVGSIVILPKLFELIGGV